MNGMTISRWGGLSRADRVKATEAALRRAEYRSGFADMVRENPGLIDAVVIEIRRVRRTEHSRYSMRTILEFLRHHTTVKTGVTDYKINNNAQKDLTTLVQTIFPELDGFFLTRSRAA